MTGPMDGHPVGPCIRQCHDHPMPARSAELSSLATALDELTDRVTAHADAADSAEDEETAQGAVRHRALPQQRQSTPDPLGHHAQSEITARRRGRRSRRGEGTPKGAFARAGRAADPELRSAEPVGGNRFRGHQNITFPRRLPVRVPGIDWTPTVAGPPVRVVPARCLLRRCGRSWGPPVEPPFATQFVCVSNYAIIGVRRS